MGVVLSAVGREGGKGGGGKGQGVVRAVDDGDGTRSGLQVDGVDPKEALLGGVCGSAEAKAWHVTFFVDFVLTGEVD